VQVGAKPVPFLAHSSSTRRPFARQISLAMPICHHASPSMRGSTESMAEEGSLVRFLGVHPGPLLYSKIFLRLEPLGLELVAQAARRGGHTVRLIDLQVEDHAAFFRLVDSWRPDVVAFSCNCLANVPAMVDMAKTTKARQPETFVCVGGDSASF